MEIPSMTAWAIKATPIAIIIGTLSEDTEKPSTKFLVRSGTTNPASVVRIPANKPIVSANFGIFVDCMSEKNGFKPACFFSIL